MSSYARFPHQGDDLAQDEKCEHDLGKGLASPSLSYNGTAGGGDGSPDDGKGWRCAEPVSASLFSFLWLGTPYIWADWAGMALMLGTIVLITLGGRE